MSYIKISPRIIIDKCSFINVDSWRTRIIFFPSFILFFTTDGDTLKIKGNIIQVQGWKINAT